MSSPNSVVFGDFFLIQGPKMRLWDAKGEYIDEGYGVLRELKETQRDHRRLTDT